MCQDKTLTLDIRRVYKLDAHPKRAEGISKWPKETQLRRHTDIALQPVHSYGPGGEPPKTRGPQPLPWSVIMTLIRRHLREG